MVFTFQLLVSFTASMCSVFAGIYCVNREGEETREKHCRYGLTGMEMREARWKRGDIKVEIHVATGLTLPVDVQRPLKVQR